MIVVLVALLIALLCLVRMRWAVYLFVFLLPFFPRSISVAVGSGGLALSERRLAIVVLFLFSLLHILTNKQAVSKVVLLFRGQKGFVFSLLLLLLVKTLSTLLNSGAGPLLYVMDDALFSLFVLLVVFINLHSKINERTLIFVMVAGLFLSGVVTIAENIKGAPILQGVVDVSVDTAGRDTLAGRERDGSYRSQALFDNPLSLAEYVCLMIPLAFFAIRSSRDKYRIIYLGAIAFVPFMLWAIYSRSGLLVALLGVFVFLLCLTWARVSWFSRFAIISTVSVIVLIIIYQGVNIIIDPASYFSSDEQGGISALERAAQYSVVITGIEQSPVIGFGLTQNYANDIDFLNHLDNYWLRLLLEGGVLALLLFGYSVIKVIRVSIYYLSRSNNANESWFYASMIAFFVSFACFKLFLSMPTNNIYFYIVAAILFWHITNARSSSGRNMVAS